MEPPGLSHCLGRLAGGSFRRGRARILSVIHRLTGREQAEEAVHASEQFKQAVLDAMIAHVAVLDREGNIVAVNKAWRRFAVENGDEASQPAPRTGVGVNYLAICRAAQGESAEGALAVHDGIQAVLEGRAETFSHDYPCHSPHARRWFSLVVTALEGNGGGAVVSHTEITPFQRLAEDLRDERDRFTKIVATVPGVICSFRLRPDGSTCFHFASPAIEDLFGLSAEVLAESAAPVRAMIHPEDLAHLDAITAASARTMTPWRAEYRLRHPVKGEIWMEGHSMPVREPDGSVIWHGYLQDITARKRAEEALQESAAIYRAIGESIDYGVWICAPDGRNTYASDSFLKLVGLTQEECSNFGWGTVLHPDDAERTIAAWKACTRTGGVWDIEHRFRRPDGQYHAILARGVPVKNVQGEIVCWAGINLDISRLKQVEEALRHSLEEKETLLREVHHRVKNNLAAIIDLLELQREGMKEAPLACQLLELGNRIRSMALVHEMLYQSDNLNRIDFQEYLQTLVAHLRNALDPQGAIRIEVAATGVCMDLDSAIPCGLIVNELVINALKYAFPGRRPRPGASTCEITVTATRDGAACTLTVADNGVGLPAGLDWAITRTLGLRLVRMLGQHQLGGQLELDGACGTRVSLRFGSRQETQLKIKSEPE